MLTPRRRRSFEHLDDPRTDAALRERSLRDVRRANTVLGGANAVLSELRRLLPSLGAEATLLDVGTGLADIPLRAKSLAARRNVRLRTFGVDEAETLARVTGDILDGSTCADARNLPFANSTFDVVICSQVLHHFEDAEVPVILKELDRVASGAVIVSDLRRSWLAVSGFWLVTWPLGFHPVSRHDGMVSVLRGFTAAELAWHVETATGRSSSVRRHLGYRLTATWTPNQ
ncbi:MAG: Methyltransferase type 11 [Gemmatimonadetes bacterium]|nr:Methyltransferase type 11 [Gemmatimonadota bacterium]